MDKKILKEIKNHKTIIIHRHKNPDGDAIGSQYGLYLTLKSNFLDKNIYVVGDLNDRYYKAKMDELGDKCYSDALVIVIDTSVKNLISDDRYSLGDKLIIIDHHTNDTDIEGVDIFYRDDNYSSAAAMITDLIRKWGLKINEEAASYLYLGMVTDTGRFLYLKKNNAVRTLDLAAFVVGFNPDIQGIYDYLYVETLESKKQKAMFSNFELTKHGVAYRKNTRDIIEKSGLDFFSVSRGMVNQMAGIKEVRIWVSFTENDYGKVIAEIRSRGIMIVDIAKEFGGGGHNEACGATLDSFIVADKMLEKLDERNKDYGCTK